MKHPALLTSAAFVAFVAFAAPAAAVAGEGDLSAVRSTMSVKNVLGALSPLEGALVTGLLVFALGCVVAVVVARKLDRNADEEAEGPEVAHFGEAPEPFYTYDEMLSGEYRGLRSGLAPSSSHPVSLPAPMPSSGQKLAAAPGSSAQLAHVPADQPSETQVMGETERAAVKNAKPAPRKAPNTLVDELPRGADPDRTNEFPRGCSVAAVLRSKTMLPPAVPAIRPIPISPPRLPMAPANVTELSYDDPETEMDLPSFPLEVQHITYAQQSEIRLLSAYQLDSDLDVAQTQAIQLVRRSS